MYDIYYPAKEGKRRKISFLALEATNEVLSQFWDHTADKSQQYEEIVFQSHFDMRTFWGV